MKLSKGAGRLIHIGFLLTNKLGKRKIEFVSFCAETKKKKRQ